MKTKIYVNNEKWVAGITIKDEAELENNNMALHACKNPADVLENRRKLANFLDCRLDDFVCGQQTHSANFYQVTYADKGRGADSVNTAIPDTDALYTYEPNVLLCSFNADCVPVMFYHERSGIVGVIHSGWQGTVKEISLKLFHHLIQGEQCHPNDFHVQVGPAISQEKFEVDEDVYLKYNTLGYADDWIVYNGETDKYHIDNQQVVKKQCRLAGIPEEHITIDSTCTYKSPDGFSYREDKKSGRHLCFVMKKK
ncbi:peptidoglycan editing factor PgeF [Lederbergia sp. NSJ-179]|uniref:peptidoglycan editing factor PgeF n=1 Tax=Lederbergia sp. NSJ-179 TaxID=2931402 RepID=UPI001FD45973|nr:peptidoglycan editing factor PgeF [Lederbergia sp. NSJ-179]MCJ7842881.1 peptidoglycan editing factor PgeF [Lederbergia sp. NSJ-179]